MLLYPDDPRGTIHIETFYSVRHNDPIRTWCQCTRGHDHDTLPGPKSGALAGPVKAPASQKPSAPSHRNSPVSASRRQRH
jgi:hypothetical protein